METRKELLDAAAATGQTISGQQLARWHRAELIPHPETHWLEWGRGTQSVYPVGTKEQLLAICAIPKRKRSHAYIAWRLWWDGYSVSMTLVREFMNDVSQSRNKAITELTDSDKGGLSETALDLADDSEITRFFNKSARQARKRIGSDRFPTLMEVVLKVVTGSFDAYDETPPKTEDEIEDVPDDQRSIAEKAFGLEAAGLRNLFGVDKSHVDTEAALRELSTIVLNNPLQSVVEAATDEELLQARNELRILLDTVRTFGEVVEQLVGYAGFRYTIYGILGNAVSPNIQPADEVAFVLYWIAFRKAGLVSVMDDVIAASRYWLQVGLPASRAIKQLVEELPALSEELSPKRMKASMNKKTAERRQNRLVELYEQNKEELDAFWRRHPEFGYTPELKD